MSGGFKGRAVKFRWKNEMVAGIRTKNPQCNSEPVDVTDDDSDGWRELLAEPGEQSVDISLSGITKSDTLKGDWFNGQRMGEAELEYPDGGVLSGQFFLANYSETGEYNEGTTFDAELQSSGEVIYVPGNSNGNGED
ncbi:hypothetical protein CAI21_21980 [Alkalilimnicola ehrlichii]|uniref:Phage major tail protein, TP901-1 family n=1 Tax=Alkalilimnicola ehrlichii TaxID=351052 RepID=A0A3E0WQA8_9GAMM|nr:phage tail tube protein [Alkalilimnicola ehrlichii]RFA24347.1 hypothetical protein CAI21_21980 [Alkalilimnicola ehrlichii]RFA35134.1 hypothetical protein CAL65_13590 [Alkalilimnicola ehrlichii]